MIRIFLFVVATVVLAVVPPEQARAGDAPKFQVEPFWPKPLPKNWILGQVAGIAVDSQGRHVRERIPRRAADASQWLNLGPGAVGRRRAELHLHR